MHTQKEWTKYAQNNNSGYTPIPSNKSREITGMLGRIQLIKKIKIKNGSVIHRGLLVGIWIVISATRTVRHFSASSKCHSLGLGKVKCGWAQR